MELVSETRRCVIFLKTMLIGYSFVHCMDRDDGRGLRSHCSAARKALHDAGFALVLYRCVEVDEEL